MANIVNFPVERKLQKSSDCQIQLQHGSNLATALAPYEKSHHIHFERYTAATDEKEKIALAIEAISRVTGNEALLDLGSGDGVLTRKLATVFKSIVAVEKNLKYSTKLQDLRNVKTVFSLMEDYQPDRVFNIALMAYSLSGIGKNNLFEVMQCLLDSLSQKGKLLCVTHAEDSAWDRFASIVRHDLGISRTGGTALHLKELQDCNLKGSVLLTLPSLIRSDSLEALAEKLSFFFLREVEAYQRNIKIFTQILGPFTVKLKTGEVALQSAQSIIEITANQN